MVIHKAGKTTLKDTTLKYKFIFSVIVGVVGSLATDGDKVITYCISV